MQICANCDIPIYEPPRSKKFCTTDCAHDYLKIKKVYGKYDIRPQYAHICRYCCEVYYNKRRRSYYCSGSHHRFARALRKKMAYRNYPRVIVDEHGNLVETHPAKNFVMSDLIGYTPRGDVPPEHTFEPEPAVTHPVHCPVCQTEAPRPVWGSYQDMPWICSRDCLERKDIAQAIEAVEDKARSHGVTPDVGQIEDVRARWLVTSGVNVDGILQGRGRVTRMRHPLQGAYGVSVVDEAERVRLAIEAAQALIRAHHKQSPDHNLL